MVLIWFKYMVDNDLVLLKLCRKVCVAQSMDAHTYSINSMGAVGKSLGVLAGEAVHKITRDVILGLIEENAKWAKWEGDLVLRQHEELQVIEREIIELRKG